MKEPKFESLELTASNISEMWEFCLCVYDKLNTIDKNAKARTLTLTEMEILQDVTNVIFKTNT